MSDNYNVALGEDPQSKAIESRARFTSYNMLKRQDSELSKAIRMWGPSNVPNSLITSSLEDYFRNKDERSDDLQRTGNLQGFLLSQVFAGLWLTVGPTLRKNTLGGVIELDGQPVTEKTCQMLLRSKGWDYGRLPVFEEIATYADIHRYSPVVEFLSGLKGAGSLEECRETLKEVGTIALGLTDPLSIEMVSRTLIGAVARAVRPGCKQQTCLVLQGRQGLLKSTFFEVLFGEDLFSTLDTNRDHREWVMAMESKWAVELAELESFTSRKASGMLKNFLSTSTDTFRRPYDRTTVTVPRHTVCVGTVNTGTPLVDDTGNRRFWMVPVPGSINLEWVRENRNRVWAAAYKLQAMREPWWFEAEEEAKAMERAEEFRQRDPWEEVLSELLPLLASEARPTDAQVETLSENVRMAMFRRNEKAPLNSATLLEMLGVSPAHQTRQHSTRLGGVMRSLGWRMKSAKEDGRVTKVWAPTTDAI